MMSFNKELENYTKELNAARRDKNIELALERAVTSFRNNLARVLEKHPDTPVLAEEVRGIKEKARENNKELLVRAREAIENNKGKTYFASDREAAIQIVREIIGTGKVIVKSKSMLGEEIGIRKALEETGNEVWETDLGEFILQLKDERPMHILTPSIHIPKEQVAEIFSKFFGREIPEEIQDLVKVVREFLREKYFQADFGITGANVVAAETGQLIIIENEGNARLCSAAPPVHIVIVGLEKLVPTFSEAMKTAEVTWRYASYTVPGYVNIISGPSKTGDIEKEITYGAHGPKELHVIFVDNGRSKIMEDKDFGQALNCLRCGGCMFECPVFQITAGHYGKTYLGGIGSIWTVFTDGGLEKAAPLIYTCLRCGRCQEQCPMRIEVPTMVGKLRKEIVYQ
ncbi:MAG: LUD domain-containing protein [Desulfitobacteriia bacterium]